MTPRHAFVVVMAASFVGLALLVWSRSEAHPGARVLVVLALAFQLAAGRFLWVVASRLRRLADQLTRMGNGDEVSDWDRRLWP